MNLLNKKCVPCEGGTKPLAQDKIDMYLPLLKNKWEVIDGKKIRHEFEFSAKGGSASGGKSLFTQAIAFVNQVAEVAENEGHHPDIHVFYNKVVIELWTHAIGGLSENDFIVAAKIEPLT